MDRRDEDMGALAWPGFVDILSAVIIMFVFFIMITAIVMSVMSVKKIEEIKKEAKDDVSEQVQEVIEMLQSGELTIEELKKAITSQHSANELDEEVQELKNEIKQLKSGLADSNANSSISRITDKELAIIYGSNSITLTEETIETIGEFLEENFDPALHLVRMEYTADPTAVSTARSKELNLGRSLNLRNSLMDFKVTPSQISLQEAQQEQIDNSYHWVRIRILDR